MACSSKSKPVVIAAVVTSKPKSKKGSAPKSKDDKIAAVVTSKPKPKTKSA